MGTKKPKKGVPPDSFAAKLTALRNKRELSIYALAKLSGLTIEAISKLEDGGRVPSWDSVVKLAEALDVSCEAFR